MTTQRRHPVTSIIVLAAVLVAASLLVAHVATPGAHPGGDNAGYVALADALAEGDGYVERWEPGAPNHTKYPPVFAGLLAMLVMLGAERWVELKIVAAAGAVVAAAATWLWARKRIPEGLAAAVAIATALSYTLLYHSRYILSDAPFLAFVMLALWLLQPPRDEAGSGGSSLDHGPRYLPWPIFGAALLFTVLAWFTRSAGLPLVLAVFAVLLTERAWRRAIAGGVVVAIPAAWWFLRSGSEQGEYGSEFLLVNPYDPALGRIDAGGMLARIGANAEGYLTQHIPAAIGGPGAAAWVGLLALVITLLAVVGWARAAWPRGDVRPGAAEFFLPLYLGIVLVWPEVWSGDRFALPVVPLLIVYAIEAIRWGARSLGEVRGAQAAFVGPALLLAGLLAAGAPVVNGLAADSEMCADLIIEDNAWTCAGAGTFELVDAARWVGDFLPDDAVVLSRKPRIFHAESGVPSRTYPFLDDPAALFAEAEEAGAAYVVLDRVSNQAVRFVGAAIVARPERFCSLRSFSVTEQGATELLGILPEGRPSGTRVSGEGVVFAACPADYRRESVGVVTDPGDRIPILID